MSLKRFVHITRVGHIDCNMEEDENGAWALVEDIEERITKLTADLEAVKQERDEFERKGKDLCSAYGNSLIEIHDLKKGLEAANKWVAELERVSSGVLTLIDTQTKASLLCADYRVVALRAALATPDSGQGGG